MGSLRASTLLLATLSLGLLQLCRGLCTRNFFAQPVIYDKAMGIDFYFTGINIVSVSACAEFCGARRFCRTAIFNSFTRTCAISYEYTLNCRYNKNRYTDFDVRHTTSHLIQVACVSKCDDERSSHMPLTTAEGAELPQTLKKVELITGEPHDGIHGSNTSPKEIRLATQLRMSSNVPTEKIRNRVSTANDSRTLLVEDAFVDSLKKSGSSLVCFRTIEHRYLLGGSFEQHSDTTIDECRCLCAETYSATRLHHCRSFQWYNKSGKCTLNRGSHMGKYDLIEDLEATYQFVSCEVQVLLGVANKVCNEDGKAVGFNGTEETLATTSLPNIKKSSGDTFPEIRTTMWNFMTEPSTTSYTTVTTETAETTTSTVHPVEKITSTESSEMDVESTTPTEITTTESITSTVSLPSEPSTTEEEHQEVTEPPNTTEVEAESSPITMITTTSPEESLPGKESERETPSFEIVRNGCFEEISGYIMTNVAGGLEHDVSIEECKCFCANSKTSRRYSFSCLSATYYPDERDCILNLDDRNRSPQLLEKQTDITVTYIGTTCGKDETIASLANSSLDANCRGTTSAPTTTMTPMKRKMGANSDDCFLEFSDFVLEGTALAIETSISVQQCKCRCIRGESTYGEGCQSFEYYFDSNTCLINKQNRFSTPEHFNFVPNSPPRSYFEQKCATRDEIRKKYLAEYCATDSNDLQDNKVGVEGNPSESKREANENEFEETSSIPITSTSRAHFTDSKIVEVPRFTTSKKTLLIEGDAGQAEKTTTIPFPSTVTMVYKRGNPKPPKWNSDSRTSGGLNSHVDENKQKSTAYEIPEAESEESQTRRRKNRKHRTTAAPPTRKPKLKRYIVRAYVNKNIPETDGLDEREFDKIIELELPDDYKGDPSKFVPPLDAEDVVVQYPSRLSGVRSVKFDTKRKKWLEEDVTTTTTTTTTTSTTTTKAPDFTPPSALVYPSVGRCTYSAMYQTAFQGTKLIRSIYVKSPGDCFAACYAHGCRSANLISNGAMNTCELYRDSIIDYRSIGMISYDGSTVYFDGIKCDGP
ncbi:hypothetical protein RB195_025810 [Necator americanus]